MRPMVFLCSPYAANKLHTVSDHVVYARRAMSDSLSRGEAPFASHLLYPQILDDSDPSSHILGIDASQVFLLAAVRLVVYADLGVSSGMEKEIEIARTWECPVVFRHLDLQ